jgi:hypothetical protein
MINDANNTNRSFKLLYKKSVKENLFMYEITTIQDELTEDSIYSILSKPLYRKMLLRSIMVDKLEDSKFIIKIGKVYYFIFEQNCDFVEYDYLVITMEQGNNPYETFIQDITKKLNDYQTSFKLCSIVSDDNVIYLILFSPVELDTPGLNTSN